MYLYMESRIVVIISIYSFFISKEKTVLEIYQIVMVQKKDHSKVGKGFPSNHGIQL